nr:MAG TPA: hypothetical protein [Caudoviricetes sp.]
MDIQHHQLLAKLELLNHQLLYYLYYNSFSYFLYPYQLSIDTDLAYHYQFYVYTHLLHTVVYNP